MTTFDSNYAYNMATQLAGFDTQTSYSRLDRNKKDYQAQQTALNTLSSALSTFQSKLSSLKGTGSATSMVQSKATLSSADYATATVGGKAQAGSYQFFVKQLASKDQVALQSPPASGMLSIGQSAMSFSVDLADVVYQTDGSLDLSKLAADINAKAKSNGLGISATLVRSGSVTNLVLTSEETGEAQKISLSLDNKTEAETATELGVKQLSSAQDAIVYLGADEANGIELKNASNTFTNIIDDVSLTFTKAHTAGDAPLTVDIAQDPGATKAKVQEFVDAYNSLMSTIKSLTASGSEEAGRGALAADGMTRGIKSMVDNLIRKDFGGESLVSLGITGKRDGSLELNGERFDKMLASKPEALDAIFKGDGATKGLLDSLLDTKSGLAVYTSSVNGILKSRKDSISDSMKRADIEYERVDTQYENLYQRYLKQYTSMMQIMSTLEQTSSLYFDVASAEKK
jgi:flagellar hook-associated protein 2